MKLALISPLEAVANGQRVAQIVDPAAHVPTKDSPRPDFEVAPPLFWTPCPDDATPETHYYDAAGTRNVLPLPVAVPPQPSQKDQDRADARAKLDALAASGNAADLRAAAAALKKVI